MSARRSFRRRLRYKFDTVLARGTVAVILWLGLITAAVVVVTGVLLSVLEIAVHGHKVGIVEGVWQNLLRSFEPAAMEADTGWSSCSASWSAVRSSVSSPAGSSAGSTSCARVAVRSWRPGTS